MRRAILMAGFVVSICQPAAAATLPLYTAYAGFSGHPSPDSTGDSTVINSAGAVFSDGRIAGAQSVAGVDGIGFSNSAGVPMRDPSEHIDGILPFSSISANSGGSYYIDDLVFSYTGEEPSESGGNALVSALFTFDGFMSLNQLSGSNSSATTSAGVNYGLGEPGTGVKLDTVGLITRQMNNGVFTATNDGVFSILGNSDSMNVNGVFSVASQVVPLDTPLVFRMGAGGRSSVVSRQDESGVSASMDFMHTFTLGDGTSIFDLPEGITVNSVQAGIVNNSFETIAPVPLPATLPMMLAGLSFICALFKRRHARKANAVVCPSMHPSRNVAAAL